MIALAVLLVRGAVWIAMMASVTKEPSPCHKNHPNAPNYYQDHYEFRYGMLHNVGKTSRAYFRKNNCKSK